jgi:hypothetical protein
MLYLFVQDISHGKNRCACFAGMAEAFFENSLYAADRQDVQQALNY